jgi:SOS response regulatory protein OraA/RecX
MNLKASIMQSQIDSTKHQEALSAALEEQAKEHAEELAKAKVRDGYGLNADASTFRRIILLHQ